MGIRERREKEREQRRADILQAARFVFDRYGLEQASMDRIAQEAELSKGTLYLYFTNRDELMVAILADDLDALLTMLEKVVTGRAKPQRRLIEAVHTFCRFSIDHQFFYRAITHLNIHQICQRQTQHSDTIRHYQHNNLRLFHTMERLVKAGVDAGDFVLDQPIPYVVMQLMLAVKGAMVVLQNGMIPPDWELPSTEDVLEDLAALLVRGLESGPTVLTRRQPNPAFSLPTSVPGAPTDPSV